MNDLENMPHSEQCRLAGEKWADLEAAAQVLEDTKSAVLSQWMAELGDLAVSRAEANVKSQPRWRELIEQIVEARKKANIGKVNYEVEKMRFNEWQNSEANRRVELKQL